MLRCHANPLDAAALLLLLASLLPVPTLQSGQAAAASQAAPLEACEQKPIITQQLSCYLEAAKAEQQPEICRKSSDPAVRFNCIGLYAEQRRDPASCELIEAEASQQEHLRAACVSGVAIAAEDPALCAQIAQPLGRDTCYAFLVIERGLDPMLCDRIGNDGLRQACLPASQTEEEKP